MSILDSFKRKEDRNRTSFTSGNFSITNYVSNNAGISEDEAMQIPAVSAAVELISSSIAQLPVYLYQVNDDGEKIIVPNDKRVMLLNKQANENLNGYNLKKAMVRDYTFNGAAYIFPKKDRNDVISLHYLPANQISVTKYIKNGFEHTGTMRLLNHTGKDEVIFESEELIRVLRDSEDGLTGEGVLTRNGNIVRLAHQELVYTKNLLENGAMPQGILQTQAKLGKDAITNLKQSLQNTFGGPNNAGKTMVLEDGLEFKQASFDPDKLQLTDSRKETLADICRAFNVPQSMLDSKANTYNSNEQDNLYFLQYCVSPIINAIEGAVNNTLLLESEKESGYFFKFDTSEMIRTTQKEKIDSVGAALKAGIISINEARNELDRNHISKDYFMWSLGSIYFDRDTEEMFIPNTGLKVDGEGNQTNTKEGNEPLQKVEKETENE